MGRLTDLMAKILPFQKREPETIGEALQQARDQQAPEPEPAPVRAPRCTLGYQRHWFTYRGRPGTSAPLCVRLGCSAPNPRYDALRDPHTSDMFHGADRSTRGAPAPEQ